MKYYNPIDVVNRALFTGLEKKKSLKVIQRYIRMKYKISISSKSLSTRADNYKPAFS